MKKINKEYLWLGYLLIISIIGILLLTNHLPVPSVRVQSVRKTQEQKPETKEFQEVKIPQKQEEENSEESLTETEEQVNPLEEKYNILLEQVKEKEQQLAECQEQIAAEEEMKFVILHKYGAQMEGLHAEYQPLINYNVKNFEAKYDTGGSETVKEVNQINYAIGELSKYTPWGITANLFTSMAIDNSNADYAAMVNANNALGTGMQKIIVATKAEIEKFTAKLDFYEMLTADSQTVDFSRYTNDKLKTIWENQYLMEYALRGNDVDIEPYAIEVYKKLYIMAAATQVLKDYYNTLLTDCDSKTRSINNLEEQYQEIMRIIDPDGIGEIVDLVETEELGKYIVPLITAGMEASNGYARLGSASPLVDSRFKYTIYGRVYWHYKAELMMAVGENVHVYYANWKPVYVNGYFFYEGRLLNGNGSEDAEALYENAAWMANGNGVKKEECEMHMANILAACGD